MWRYIHSLDYFCKQTTPPLCRRHQTSSGPTAMTGEALLLSLAWHGVARSFLPRSFVSGTYTAVLELNAWLFKISSRTALTTWIDEWLLNTVSFWRPRNTRDSTIQAFIRLIHPTYSKHKSEWFRSVHQQNSLYFYYGRVANTMHGWCIDV